MGAMDGLSSEQKLALEITKRAGRRDALAEVMEEIYEKRFDYEGETAESRNAYSKVWYKMQAKYLEDQGWLENMAKVFG